MGRPIAMWSGWSRRSWSCSGETQSYGISLTPKTTYIFYRYTTVSPHISLSAQRLLDSTHWDSLVDI